MANVRAWELVVRAERLCGSGSTGPALWSTSKVRRAPHHKPPSEFFCLTIAIAEKKQSSSAQGSRLPQAVERPVADAFGDQDPAVAVEQDARDDIETDQLSLP